MMKLRPAVSAAAIAALFATPSVAAQDIAPDAGQTIVLPPELDESYVAPAQPYAAPIEYDPVLPTIDPQNTVQPYSAPYAQPYAEPYREPVAQIPYSATYERDAWLDYCRANYLDRNGLDRSGALGGLLGAAAGGLLGNRIASGERLAGTLIGAGVGGLAGLAIGSAVDADARRDRLDDCEIYLRYADTYPRRPDPYYNTPVRPAYGTAFYGPYGQPMMLVPVMVPIQQRVIVREYVTEEYID